MIISRGPAYAAPGCGATVSEVRPTLMASVPLLYERMYSRVLEDPDGNILGFLFLEPAASEQGPEAYMAQQGASESATA